MKRIISIILAMGIIFSFGFSSFAVQDIELEEKIISRLITSFFEACKRKDIAKAKSMTTDKEKKIFESILKESKKTNGILPADLSKYFSRLRDFKVNVVQLDESGDKAVAICTYEFKYYDSKSKDEIRKDREVFYYLKKVSGHWKISFSKIGKEKYYYKSKTNRKRIIGY